MYKQEELLSGRESIENTIKLPHDWITRKRWTRICVKFFEVVSVRGLIWSDLVY